MKKIAHIVNSNIYSGLEKVATSIIKSLSNDYEMIYVTKDGPIVEMLKELNINYYIIEDMNIKSIKKFINEWHPDILHTHDYRASLICSLVNKKIPLIFHLHNNATWIKKICPNSISFLYASLKANKILTVSESIEKEYVFSKFIKNKFECIGNPVSREEILKKVENSPKRYDICCIGRLVDVKDPKRFIRIIKDITQTHPNIKVIWVGDGELKEECLQLIDELNLKNNIEFVGFQKNPYQFLAESKVFMLTSKWEGYGLAAFEALTLGLPCIVTNVGGLSEIVDNECGKLCSNDEEIKDAVIELLNNEKKYIIMKNNAIQKSKELDNTKTYINSLKEIYELY